MTRRKLAALSLAVLAVSLSVPAFAAGKPAGRGFVDGRAFLDFASQNEEDTLVEVNVSGALLRAAAKAVDERQAELAQSIAGLSGVRALVLQVRPEREQDAIARSRDMGEDLVRQGWEPLARVREEGTNLNVLILLGPDEDTVEGLTVVGFEKDEHQLIFVNIAGPMKMSDLGKISKRFDLPGINVDDDEDNDATAAPGARK
ncbi:MAG: DUF4252 domain-containing protein [Acidobacteria bacterium]|nr:DUF4252 domain-containing protein [Acidobacteriota bacterium]